MEYAYNDDFLYQVGDVVKVRKDLKHTRYTMRDDKYNGVNAVDKMLNFAGTYVTIRSLYHSGRYRRYTIEEDNGLYFWVDDMFESVPEETLPEPDSSWEDFFLS